MSVFIIERDREHLVATPESKGFDYVLRGQRWITDPFGLKRVDATIAVLKNDIGVVVRGEGT